jgi:CheY-like chemotaxis protein
MLNDTPTDTIAYEPHMLRILVIEDDESTRQVVSTILCRAGYSVRTAPEGSDALRQLAVTPADLILTDIFMPGMDGLAFIRQIRHEHPHTRIIAVTGQPERGNAVSFAAVLGADRVLTKPVNHEQLLTAITDTLADKAPDAVSVVATDQKKN